MHINSYLNGSWLRIRKWLIALRLELVLKAAIYFMDLDRDRFRHASDSHNIYNCILAKLDIRFCKLD